MNKYLIYDTETENKNPYSTDINIHDHIPFLVSYIVADEKLNETDRGVFKVEDQVSKNKFDQYLKDCPTVVGANIKYDVHMLMNIGYDKSWFESKNYIDVQVLARLCINNDLQSDETFSVALKKLAVKYLGVDSNEEEQRLKRELSALTIQHKQQMKEFFKANGVWPQLTTTKETQLLNEIYTNWNKVYDKYTQYSVLRKQFFKQYPRPTYRSCQNVYTYAMTDAVLTYKLLRLWYPEAIRLEQTPTLMRVSAATFPLIIMERKGMSVNISKVASDRNLLINELNKNKIISPITGEEVSVDQNAKLKEIYEFETGMQLANADEHTRSLIADKSPTAKLVSYKKKLNKYLNSYVTRIFEKLSDGENGDFKIYTQYKLAGTVTGRLSSDFQQFPKEPLELETGDVINIRSWFKVPTGDKYLFYFDYSQLELRLQCEWTNLINGEPDLNMTRAFMPYRCINKDGKYYLEEDPSKEWVPTDMHAMTAKNAFPGIDESDPNWKHYRTLGKRCNFACNYGASAPKLVDSLDVDFDTAKRLVDGYKKAFKGVVDFGRWIQNRTYTINKFPNLFKRIYYSTNKHQLQNWLVQGSGADLLLIKLQQTYEYLKTHPWWTYVITVHDEIGFACKDIPIDQLKKEVAEIKEIMKQSLSAVDIISDVEYTTTDWGHKEDYEEESFNG